MPLLCNIHELEKNSLNLRGELSIAELELDELDEQIRLSNSVEYDLQAQLIDRNILLKGHLLVILIVTVSGAGAVRPRACFDRLDLPSEPRWRRTCEVDGRFR
jgi:hypothetical protein